MKTFLPTHPVHAIHTVVRVLASVATVAAIFAMVPAHADAPGEDEAALERAHAERLRRAIEKREMEDANYARRRGAELGKQSELTRLQARIATLERDESMLHGDLRHAETQLLYQRRDPADMSAHTRRSELESRVSHYRSQLLRVTADKQNALRQLNELRLR